MPMPRILACSPVHQKPSILEAFLASLHRLTCKSFQLEYLFVDDNEDARSSALLDRFDAEHPGDVRILSMDTGAKAAYVCDDTEHRWDRTLILKVAMFKNRMIEMALEEGYDYIFFIDSDLLVHPHLIEHLYDLQKELICEIFWTQWRPGTMELPNVWMYDQSTFAPHEYDEELTEQETHRRTRDFCARLRVPGIYEVGGLGACTLIARSAFEKGVSFARIPNLTFMGEDRFFCIRAAVLGIPLLVDTHYPAYHIYRESHLPGAYSYLKSTERGRPLVCRTKVSSF